MAICNCCLTIIANYMETFYYQTAPLNFYTIFPVVISVNNNRPVHSPKIFEAP
ncbi:hypothetical protein Anas_12043 [Armadillidium nasatum]|uniref:Uncharacterized protein n=1 Tax=Armadillidium nasatum TaxID=96803 RepID=A0A5N5T2C9_9CRUS|nr:hypothetical protein Anas_12043 [Armadillidium nasatum]